MEYQAQPFDIAVIGAGHAGVEGRFGRRPAGASTVLFTMSLTPSPTCLVIPPSAGRPRGIWSGRLTPLGGRWGGRRRHLYSEQDAKPGKGPAVHSLRVQADRAQYHIYKKRAVERQQNPPCETGRGGWRSAPMREGQVESVVTRLGAVHPVKLRSYVLGLSLNGKIFVGIRFFQRPRWDARPKRLSDSLVQIGLPCVGLKPGPLPGSGAKFH